MEAWNDGIAIVEYANMQEMHALKVVSSQTLSEMLFQTTRSVRDQIMIVLGNHASRTPTQLHAVEEIASIASPLQFYSTITNANVRLCVSHAHHIASYSYTNTRRVKWKKKIE